MSFNYKDKGHTFLYITITLLQNSKYKLAGMTCSCLENEDYINFYQIGTILSFNSVMHNLLQLYSLQYMDFCGYM